MAHTVFPWTSGLASGPLDSLGTAEGMALSEERVTHLGMAVARLL